ncbi:MAG: DNA polymerase III subunit delta' [Pseudomonadota bacterium]
MSEKLLIPDSLRDRANSALSSGALEGGWLITGPRQVGKGTFARALAAAMLSHTDDISQAEPRIVTQVENEGHPDLFVLRRTPDPKTGKLPANIKVDEVREVISRFRQTSATGRRIVIIDTADELNPQAANALLKTLEEPPAGASLLLLSVAAGRLLPTIRSRCRRMDMPALPVPAVATWLERQHQIEPADARDAAEVARGRPGRALELAAGEGRLAKEMADGLVKAAAGRGDIIAAARRFGEKDAEDARRDAQELVLARLTDAARQIARGEGTDRDFPSTVSAHHLVELHDEIASLVGRAEALNADRVQTALMMAMTLQDGLRGHHVGR